MDPTPNPRHSWQAILETVHKELCREFKTSVPPEQIEEAAMESVREFLHSEVRVRTFLPILAGKRARQRLRGSSRPGIEPSP